MKVFIKKTVTLASILIVLILTATQFPIDQDNYLKAYNKKCERLEHTQSPRIIFVGGSNLAFGLDSQRIKDSLNINVINYGLHAGIGLKYMIDDISEYASKGDVIVFSPEYDHFYTTAYGEAETISLLMAACRWKKTHLLGIRQWINVLSGIPQLIWESSLIQKNKNPKDYRASGFNEYGDEIQHWTLESQGFGAVKPIKGTFNKQFGDYFIEKVKTLQKVCSVFVIPPIYAEKAYDKNKKKINEVEEFLKKRMPILGNT